MAVIYGRIDQTSAMGATLGADGTGFRTWAPNARSVAVVADARLTAAQAPGWQPAQQDLLAPLGDGTWGGFLAGVDDGDRLHVFCRRCGQRGLETRQLRAGTDEQPAFPGSFCIVRDATGYPWHDQGWRTPRFPNLVIYQLHIGTWWAQDDTGNDVRSHAGWDVPRRGAAAWPPAEPWRDRRSVAAGAGVRNGIRSRL